MHQLGVIDHKSPRFGNCCDGALQTQWLAISPSPYHNVYEFPLTVGEKHPPPPPNPSPSLTLSLSCCTNCHQVASGEDKSGTTAVCALITEKYIIIANCGDSRGVFCVNGKPALATQVSFVAHRDDQGPPVD